MNRDELTPSPLPSGEVEGLVVRLTAVATAWTKHAEAVERVNAAIPALEATRAERAVYDERYRASEQCKRDMYGAAFEFAKWCAETKAADTIASLQGRVVDWQPIETAPKDGTTFLCWAEGFEWPEVIRWFEYDEHTKAETGEEGFFHYAEELLREVTDTCCEELTHWRPMLDPPASRFIDRGGVGG